jgi:hypothetical protein
MGIFKEMGEKVDQIEAAQFKRTMDSAHLFCRDGVFYLGKWGKWQRASQPEADRLLAEFRAEHPEVK